MGNSGCTNRYDDLNYNLGPDRPSDAQIRQNIVSMFGGARGLENVDSEMSFTRIPINLDLDTDAGLNILDGGSRSKKTKRRRVIKSKMSRYSKYDISNLSKPNKSSKQSGGDQEFSAISVSELNRMRNLILADHPPSNATAQDGGALSYDNNAFSPATIQDRDVPSLLNLMHSIKNTTLRGGACDDKLMSDSEAHIGGGRGSFGEDNFSQTSSFNKFSEDSVSLNLTENSRNTAALSDSFDYSDLSLDYVDSAVGKSDKSSSNSFSNSYSNSFNEDSLNLKSSAMSDENGLNVAPFYSDVSSTDYEFQQPYVKNRFD